MEKPEKTRTAVMIRCSPEDAELIRSAAKQERRTLASVIVIAIQELLKQREVSA